MATPTTCALCCEGHANAGQYVHADIPGIAVVCPRCADHLDTLHEPSLSIVWAAVVTRSRDLAPAPGLAIVDVEPLAPWEMPEYDSKGRSLNL